MNKRTISLLPALTAIALAMAARGAFAAEFAVPQLPQSPYDDTEISTNVAFSAGGDDARTYFDIRTFGAVMSTGANAGQARGPVQITFARSVDPVVTLEHSITRMAVATEAEAEKQSGDNRTMGRKNTVPYGLYVAYGFVSPALAAQTGFSEEDLEALWMALVNMFDQDHSAARGMMATQKLIIFKHDSALGNAPSHKLFDLVKIAKKEDVVVPRKFADYEVVVPKKEDIPSGVEVIEK